MKLANSFLWATSGRALYIIFQAIVIIYFTKKFSSIEIGYYGIALAITNPIFKLFDINLRALLVTDIRNQFSYNNYFNVRALNSVLAFFIILFILLIMSFSYKLTAIIVIMTLFKVIEGFSDIYYSILEKHERQDIITKSLILKILLILSFMVLSTNYQSNFIFVLLSMHLPVIFILKYWDSNQCYKKTGYRHNFFKFKKFKKTYININKIGISLGMADTLNSINSSIPKLLIAQYLSTALLGVFVPISYIYSATNNFISAIKQVLIAKLSKLFYKNMILFHKRIKIFLLYGIILALFFFIITYVFGNVILASLFTKDYSSQKSVLVILMLASGAQYTKSLISSALLIMRKHNIQPYINGIALFINFMIGVFLIPNYGLKGAAFSLLVTNLFSFFIYLIFYLIDSRSIEKQ